jgi:hypothetical protein
MSAAGIQRQWEQVATIAAGASLRIVCCAGPDGSVEGGEVRDRLGGKQGRGPVPLMDRAVPTYDDCRVLVLRKTLIPEKAGVGVSIGVLFCAVGLAVDDALCFRSLRKGRSRIS